MPETSIRTINFTLGLLMVLAFLQVLRFFIFPKAARFLILLSLLLLVLSIPALAAIRAGHW